MSIYARHCNAEVYTKKEEKVGDLKKKKINFDYTVRTKDGREVLIERHTDKDSEEKFISELQDYIQLFYERQMEKGKKEEKEDKKA